MGIEGHFMRSNFKLLQERLFLAGGRYKYQCETFCRKRGRRQISYAFSCKDFLREFDKHRENVEIRKAKCDLEKVKSLCLKYGEKCVEVENLRKRQRVISEKIKNGDAKGCMEDARKYKAEVQLEESRLRHLKKALLSHAINIPNYVHLNTPRGSTPIEVEVVGQKCLPTFTNGQKRLSYVDIIQKYDLADFEKGGKVTGTGFYYMKNAGVVLEQALLNYAMRECSKNNFSLFNLPAVVRSSIMTACGYNPRSEDSQVYMLQGVSKEFTDPKSKLTDTTLDQKLSEHSISPVHEDEDQLVLSATGEYLLCGYCSNTTFLKSDLPLKISGMSPCFRAEGFAGNANRNLYRVHQFNKFEMVMLTDKLTSDAALESLVKIQKSIFSGIGLCYRLLDINTEDIGAPAYKKFDLEAWLPSKNSWGEISSASNCTDYQSRRLNIRYFSKSKTGATEYVHTLNATACAIPRVIIAILEQFQQQDGDVYLPSVLLPSIQYICGKECHKLSDICRALGKTLK